MSNGRRPADGSPTSSVAQMVVWLRPPGSRVERMGRSSPGRLAEAHDMEPCSTPYPWALSDARTRSRALVWIGMLSAAIWIAMLSAVMSAAFAPYTRPASCWAGGASSRVISSSSESKSYSLAFCFPFPDLSRPLFRVVLRAPTGVAGALAPGTPGPRTTGVPAVRAGAPPALWLPGAGAGAGSPPRMAGEAAPTASRLAGARRR
mmetsp:Transcript_39499/g.90931  ORF Transcript_39499/g.90931 Transcript_39499/m.90931 type:complete len:205 (+) Transcript_39499:420-1034(+)